MSALLSPFDAALADDPQNAKLYAAIADERMAAWSAWQSRIAAAAAPAPTVTAAPIAPRVDAATALRTAIARTRRAPTVARVAPEQTEEERARLARAAVDRMIVIGVANTAKDCPHGAIVGWRPWPSRTYGQIVRAATAAGVSALAPASVASVYGDAIAAVAASRGMRRVVLARGSRWRLERAADADARPGESSGAVACTITRDGSTITVDHDGSTGAMLVEADVRARYQEMRDAAIVEGHEIARWIGSIVVGELRGTDSALGRYWIPSPCVDRWIALADALASIGLPSSRGSHATMSDMRADLSAGLRSEIDAAVSRIAGERDRARAGGASDIGARGAATACRLLADLRSKIDAYDLICGDLSDVRAALVSLAADLDSLTDATVQRGAMLDLDPVRVEVTP